MLKVLDLNFVSTFCCFWFLLSEKWDHKVLL